MIDIQKLLNPSSTRVKQELESIDTEQDYHNHFAIGNSDLKQLEKSPRHFINNVLDAEPEEDPYIDMSYHIKMGTMIEQKLLEREKFKENFIYRGDMNTPSSPNQKEFVDLILTGQCDIEEAHDVAYAYSTPDKAQALFEDLKEYIDFQNKAEGKGEFDKDEKAKMSFSISDIRMHNRANRLLCEDRIWEKTWTQKPIMANIKGVFCKCLIDRLIWDGEKFILIDLKTTSKSLPHFIHPFLKRRYYRQFAHYARMVVSHFSGWLKGEDVKVKPIIIVARKEEPYGTIVREVPGDLMRRGIEELDALLERLRWHIEEDQWFRPQDYYLDDKIKEMEYDNVDIPAFRL